MARHSAAVGARRPSAAPQKRAANSLKKVPAASNLQLLELLKKTIGGPHQPVEAELLAQLDVGPAARKPSSLSSSTSHSDSEHLDDEAVQVDAAAGGQSDQRQHLAAEASAQQLEQSGAKRRAQREPESAEEPSAAGPSGAREHQREPEGEGARRPDEWRAELVWRNIIAFVVLHTCIPLSVYLVYQQRCWKTLAFSVLGMYVSGLGITGGAHRLWSHRSYKAKWPVQLLLMCWQTMAGQNSIYTWSRDHRLHHKFAETNADPHNIERGFFFAHMGWLCCRKHPDVKAKGKLIDMSDLEANRLVMFQHRNFWWLAVLFMIVIPVAIPVYFWGESLWTSFVLAFMLRYLVLLHGTWLVNSAAHYTGWRPYDKRIEARESPYAIFSGLGEGFHNYHHTFPFDYATSEFGRFWNLTTAFIDLCASLGLVRDRRTAERSLVQRRKMRTGDLAPDLAEPAGREAAE